MKLKKSAENLFEQYKKSAEENKRAKMALDIALSFTDAAEKAMEEYAGGDLSEVFESARKQIKVEGKVTGAIKNAAYTIIEKVWEYGDLYRKYSQVKEDGYYKQLQNEL